jgi:hypothetical protein
MRPSRSLAAFACLLALSTLASCGGGGGREPYEPFTAQFPNDGPGDPIRPHPPVPPPPPVTPAAWNPQAYDLERTALFGSFPSDLVRLGEVLFTTDADAIEGEGARIVAVDVSGPHPVASPAHEDVVIEASDLVDSDGLPCDPNAPIGFGFFLNDLCVVSDRLGFVLANAGGSDSVPTCSNLVVFDPTAGDVIQTVNLANPYATGGGLVDSAGNVVPGGTFTQAAAEGIEFVPTAGGKGLVFVAMANFIVAGPSFGNVKYPGTVQVFDVDLAAAAPVSPRVTGPHATQTIGTRDYNPSAVTRFTPQTGPERILISVAGTTAFDASFNLVPVTNASVEAYDAASQQYLGTFDLGLAALASSRPAIGRDGVGQAVGFFASSVLGEVFLLRLDGLDQELVDPTRVGVLRGPNNGIPIQPESAGKPGGNVAGLALSSDGRTLLASGFGDFFAVGGPAPGRLFALSLPVDIVESRQFPRVFVPGTSTYASAPGRTLGPVVLVPGTGGGAEVWVTVGGAVDPSSFLGLGPASLGSLHTFGAVK